MKVSIKRIVCLVVAIIVITSSFTTTVHASFWLKSDGDIFYGYINIMGAYDEEPNIYSAARDKNDRVYIGLEDFVKIAGGSVEKDVFPNSYRFILGKWRLVVECEEKIANVYYNPGTTGLGYLLYEDFVLPECLYHKEEESWYLPLEEMLYMTHMQWLCEENTVFIFRPENLLDFVAELNDLRVFHPTYLDIIGEELKEQIWNSFKYGFGAAIDELDMTFLMDSMLTNLIIPMKESMDYEEDVLISALLMLRSDLPEGDSKVKTIGTESFSNFVAGLSTALDGATQNKVLNVLQKMYGTSLDTKSMQAFSKRYGLAASVAGHLFSAGQILWMREQIPEGFKARMELMRQTAEKNQEDEFCKKLAAASDEVIKLYVDNVKSAYTDKINLDSVFTLVDQVIGVVDPKVAGFEIVAPKLNSAALGVALFDLGVETMKEVFPAMEIALDKAEDMYVCLNLVNISNVMNTVYEEVLFEVRKYQRGVDEKMLTDIRLSAQVMECAAMHASATLIDNGKLEEYVLGFQQEALMRLNESAKYDKLIILDPKFSDIHAEVDGCMREAVPSEYVMIKVTGSVMEKDTQNIIPEAEITFKDKEENFYTVWTDEEGNFEILVGTGVDYEGNAFADGYYSQTKEIAKTEITESVIFELKKNLPLLEAVLIADEGTERIKVEAKDKTADIPKIWIQPKMNKWNTIERIEIEHEDCTSPFVFDPANVVEWVNFFAVDMGDGEYTYVINGYNNGTKGGASVIVLRMENNTLKPIKMFDLDGRTDNIYVEGVFIDADTVSGIIYPTETKFKTDVSYPSLERIGKDIAERGLGHMMYEVNEEGFYNIVFQTLERSLYDIIGGSKTRYILKDDKMIIDEQWFEAW